MIETGRLALQKDAEPVGLDCVHALRAFPADERRRSATEQETASMQGV